MDGGCDGLRARNESDDTCGLRGMCSREGECSAFRGTRGLPVAIVGFIKQVKKCWVKEQIEYCTGTNRRYKDD